MQVHALVSVGVGVVTRNTYLVLRNGRPVYPTWRNQRPYTNRRKALADCRRWAACDTEATFAVVKEN